MIYTSGKSCHLFTTNAYLLQLLLSIVTFQKWGVLLGDEKSAKKKRMHYTGYPATKKINA